MKLKKHFELVMTGDKVLCKVELSKTAKQPKGEKDASNLRPTWLLQRL